LILLISEAGAAWHVKPWSNSPVWMPNTRLVIC